jgi:hypothetical protein
MATLNEIVAWLKEKEERAAAEAEEFAAQHLPVLADLAEQAASNPLVDAALKVVHVSPEILSGMASVLLKLDADLAALQPAPAPVPAEPAPPA